MQAVCAKCSEGATQNGFTSLAHQPQIKGEIMQAQQDRTEHFLGSEEMMEIGTREMPAAVAIAEGIQRC